MNKAQARVKERVKISLEIYKKHRNNSERPRSLGRLDREVTLDIQLELSVSERKAKEYLKLAKHLYHNSSSKK